jgi:hypothetical protein
MACVLADPFRAVEVERERDNMLKRMLATAALATVAGAAGAQNLAPNPSFEVSGPGFIVVDQWTNFTTNADVAFSGDPIPNGGGTFSAQDGQKAIIFFGGGNGLNNQTDTVYGVDLDNDTVEDLLPVVGGQDYMISGYSYIPSSAPLEPRTGSNGTMDRFGHSFYAIADFRDADGNRTARIRYALYEGRDGRPDTNDPPQDEWVQWQESIAVPAETVEAQFIFVMVTYGDPPGVCYIDNVFFGPANAGPMGCNAADIAEPFDSLTFADISAFLSAFTNSDPVADLADPVGSFTFADITAFLNAFSAGCP